MVKISTTDSLLWLVNVNNPKERVKIQFFPAQLSVDRVANVQDIDIVGRNNPLHHYSGGTTSLPLELDFYAERDDLKDVIETIKLIESWTFNDGYDAPIPQIKLLFGDLFQDTDTWTIKRCSYRMTQFVKEAGLLPRQAYMSLELTMDTRKDLRARDVRR